MNETPLEMASRHVAEGEGRIARQKRLIAELARDGHERMLPEAEKFLRQLEQFQAEATQHVARLLNKEEQTNGEGLA